MNFFGLQDSARRDSLILLSVFTVAMLLFAWLINSVVAAFVFMANFMGRFYTNEVIQPQSVQWVAIATVWSYILYKCYVRYKAISKGGSELAAVFGAELSLDNVASGQEKTLHNVNAEMAVASTQSLMPCFVMRDEQGINAFVLGDQRRPALVVTQGALNKLDREEISAVVAHEYAHVSNDDLKLNMRMLIALGGLNAITEFGKECLNPSTEIKQSRIRSNSYSGDRSLSVVYLIGAISCLLGWVLSFFGELIKSGFSRKRELLADAKAVQFTRSSWGMASAIDKGTTHSKKPSLRSVYNSELDHLCLIGPWGNGFFSGLQTNHPAPQSRIDLLEPYFSVKKRSREKRRESAENSATTQGNNFSLSVGTDTGPEVDERAGQGTSVASIHDVENEIAVVLSVMIGTAGYNQENSQANFNSAMRSYTNSSLPMRLSTDPLLKNEFDKALDTLAKQSQAQRVAFVNHLQELMEHDGISAPEEKRVLAYVTDKLYPSGKAA